MVDIQWGILGNSLAQPNPGERFQMGFQQGQEQAKQRARDNALAQLGAAPDDPQALAGLYRVDPRLGLQYGEMLRERQRDAAKLERDKHDRDAKVIAALARDAKDPAMWDAAVDQVVAMGYADAAQYKGKFSPALRSAMMAAGGVQEEQSHDPSSVQEYEYAKGQGFQGSYMDFMETKRGPLVANNGDGTITLIPRSMVPGGAAPQGSVPPPPPGFVLDNDGGPTPPASGNFPQ